MAARRRFRWGFAAVGLVLIGLVVWLIFFNHPPAKPAKPATTPVTTAVVGTQDVDIAVTAIGAAQAWQGVTIHTQVNGRLIATPFKEGTDVRKGAILAQIDPAPYRAALLQAEGTLKRDQAILEGARVDLARYKTLAAQDSIARQTYEDEIATVKADEGTVLLDQGAVDAAKVNLAYCTIRSPVDGRVGLRLVDPGNIVSTSDTTGILIVNQITPIAVTFTIPQGDFQRLARVSNGFTKPLATTALSQETNTVQGQGELSIADNRVDPTTGTVAMKARFANADKHLWPGEFLNIRLSLQTLKDVTVIPASAVNQGPNGMFAYVVGADHKAAVRPITLVTTQDAVAVVKSGLKPGETVVTDGQMILKPGALVATPKPGSAAAAPAGKPAA
jgi:multidrug efflux system membrane fusion protein